MARREGIDIMDSIEKHTIKISLGIAFSVIIFLLVMSFNLATYKSHVDNDIININSRVDHLSDKYVDIRSDIDYMQEKATARDIQLTEIKTKLANIELLLIEIKQDIKEK
jgi:peptidoglycan hydrolase CwlO-like protein